MPVPAFNVTAASHEHRRFEFWGVHNSDYYEGESRPLPPAESDMHIEKSFAGAYAIYRLTAHSGISFRRSWSHIRSDKTDVMVFWFVRRGTISVSYADIKHVSGPQECAFIRSSRAFYTELNPDTAGLVEAIYVVVPSHELHSIISNGLEAGRPYPSSKGDLFVVERILSLLFEEDDQLDSAIAEQLVKTLVLGLCKSITRSSGNPPPRLTVVEKRISDISACINRHFANPDLNTRMVAEKCGISLRYLCHILKKKPTLLLNPGMGTADGAGPSNG